MSRFSGIDSQHTALRDLERQRLERQIGKLRSAAIDKAAGSNPESVVSDAGRRFQPKRRSGYPSVAQPRRSTDCLAAVEEDLGEARPQGWSVEPEPPPRRGEVADGRREPADSGAGPERVVAALPPSAAGAELAWLWRLQGRMEQDAEEVRTFLTRMGLERYIAVLLDSPEGVGASMQALRAASDDDLRELGLPPGARIQLASALKEPSPPPRPGSSAALDAAIARRATAGTPSRPGSGGSSSAVEESRVWGRLGRVPVGWELRSTPQAAGGVRTLPSPKVLVDTGCGDSEPLPPEAFQFGATGTEGGACASSAAAAPLASASPSPVPRMPATPVAAGAAAAMPSRPGTAGAAVAGDSRPGTSGGSGGEKTACYECFKQVFTQRAIQVEDCDGVATECGRQVGASMRHFCGESCADCFRKALAARCARARELLRLREAAAEGGGPVAA